jgi:hypothetical protein
MNFVNFQNAGTQIDGCPKHPLEPEWNKPPLEIAYITVGYKTPYIRVQNTT